MRLILLLVITFLLTGCNKQSLIGFTEYEIKQGEHFSVRNFSTISSDDFIFEAKFDASAKYETINPTNQGDINKLLGFSECNQSHQENSARFGWRWFNNSLEIHSYVYNNGVRSSKFIKSVGINETHNYSITIDGDKYIFSVDSEVVMMDRTNTCNVGIYYKLYPYFGGDETAPHDIRILIREKRRR